MKKTEALTKHPAKHKKHPVPGKDASIPLPWWKKARKYLGFSGVLAVLLALGGLGYTYWDVLWPTLKVPDLPDEPEEKERTTPQLNPFQPPGPAPEGMVWIPGGEFYMGIDLKRYEKQLPKNQFFIEAYPPHKVYVDGFWMDKHEITNDEFARFVKETGYLTVAEKQPDPKEFPGLDPSKKLEPFSIVFIPLSLDPQKEYDSSEPWFKAVNGASWKLPQGPGSNIIDKEKHPVVHICYDDALAYCKWAKKRLPTEAEWEFAARGGLDNKLYAWGDEYTPEGKWMANTWQGNFPYEDDKLDGYHGTAPVGSYPPNDFGLYDVAGNVWEWCSDWYRPDYYSKSPDRNPRGPASGFDPVEQGVPKRVQRGGSFICSPINCTRYIMGSRGKGEPTSACSHTGFRCVMDPR